jgi:streptogramin lyase
MLNLVAAVLSALGGAAPAVAQSFNEFPVPSAASNPVGIALGLDGNLWFTEFAGNKIGVITPAGTVTEFPLPTNSQGQSSQPLAILRAPDGTLWFTMSNASRIGRITTAGQTSFFNTPTSASGPEGLAVGSNGNFWFTEIAANKIGRLTPSGTFNEFAVPIAALRGLRLDRTATCGSPNRSQQNRADHDERRHHRVRCPHRQ